MAGDEAKPYSKEMQLRRGPRKYRREVAGPKRRAEIAAAKGGRCRTCGALPTTFHHVVPKGSPYFGGDTEANWVPLCGDGTTGCHGRIEARDPVTSRLLCEALDDSEYSYAIEHGGENFFERRYMLRYERA